MSKLYYPITACLKKSHVEDSKRISEDDKPQDMDKKISYPQNSDTNKEGLIWKVSSGIYNVGAGAVGMGVGGVKWAASTTLSVGGGVISVGNNIVGKVKSKPKTKNE